MRERRERNRKREREKSHFAKVNRFIIISVIMDMVMMLQVEDYISQAESVVADVSRVLGRKRGLRIGEEADRDGQYYHYLTKWMFALGQLGKYAFSAHLFSNLAFKY